MIDIDRLCVWCMQEKMDAAGTCEHCGRDNAAYIPERYHLSPWSILRGRYLIGSCLGEGGFGITYIAMDLLREERVAVKEMYIAQRVRREKDKVVLSDLSPEGIRYYSECKTQFLLEARILYQLEDKSGVVQIYDFFEENDTAYIVMEYLDGQDLKEFLRTRPGGKITYESAFMLLRPIMKTLIQVHSAGIIHRDVSPDNIRYLRKEKRMKIMDCGSSRTMEVEDSSQMIYLKSGYAPPEQYASGYQVGPWMDVYAMSATLYRCITGKMPRPANDRLLNDDLAEPIRLGANITPAQQEVILRGMALDVSSRYPDMWTFYQALKEANAQAEEKPPAPRKPPVKILLLCILWCVIVLAVIAAVLLIRKSKGM